MNLINFLIQANLYLVVFYGFYLILLRNETFFNFNRIYLIGSALLSTLIPVIQSEWVHQLFVSKEVENVANSIYLPELILNQPIQQTSVNALQVLTIIYFAGVIFFMIRFAVLLSRVNSVELKRVNPAFSFFHRIFISDEVATPDIILKHEQVHVKQLHSADVILLELVAIINWFNPIAYLYKKAIKSTHEFIADEFASSEISKSEYALLLLSNALSVKPHQLTNNFFNESLIKRRISMLHKARSRKAAILKYGLAAPLFAGMVILSAANAKPEYRNEMRKIRISKTSDAITDAPQLNEKEVDQTEQKQLIAESETKSPEPIETKAPVPATLSLETADSTKTQSIYKFNELDVKPEYPGGIKELFNYIARNFVYPKEAREKGIAGKLILSFVVEKDGSINEIQPLKDLGAGTTEEAVRVLSNSPKWKPGIVAGEPVRTSFVLPVQLNIVAEKKPEKTETF